MLRENSATRVVDSTMSAPYTGQIMISTPRFTTARPASNRSPIDSQSSDRSFCDARRAVGGIALHEYSHSTMGRLPRCAISLV